MNSSDDVEPAVDEMFRRGRRCAERGDISSAVNIFINEAIAADPENPAPYLGLTDILIEVGLLDDALQVLSEAPAPTDSTALLEREAMCRVGRGDDQEASRAAHTILEREPHNSTALAVLGTLKAREGSMAEAEASFRHACTAEPRNAQAWLSLGMLLWSGGNTKEAFDALCQAVDTSPLAAETFCIFIDMARRLNMLEDALLQLKKTCRTHTENRAAARATIEVMAELDLGHEALEAAQAFLVKFGIDDDVMETALDARRKTRSIDRLVEGGTESFTLCMIVRNEEKNLPRCLASVLLVVHEMVIVDTGSDDRTMAIAEIFGARVVHHAWNDDYAAARNIGLAAARGAWVLVLDADEALSELDHPLIRNAVRHGTRTAWQVMTRNYTEDPIGQGWEANDGAYPPEEVAAGWYPSWKVRLFPRCADIRFQGRVHEMVEPALRDAGFDIRRASFVVHHYGELDRNASLARKRRYYELGKEKLAGQPDDAVLLTELAVQAGELEMPAEALALWDRVLAKEPENVEALFNRGGILLLLERYAPSKEDSRRGVTLQPSHREARLNLALAELHLGEIEQAHLEVNRLEPLSENYPPFWGLALMDAIVAGDGARTKRYADLLERHGFGIPLVIDSRAASLERAGQAEPAFRLRQWLTGC